MLDHAGQLLLELMHQQATPGVCAIDEAFHAAITALPTQDWHYVTNRFDLAQQLHRRCGNTQVTFSDFQIDRTLVQRGSGLYFRIAKEKAVNHYVINQALDTLQAGQLLCLSGYKQEGIKSLQDRCEALLGPPLQQVSGGKSSRLLVFRITDSALGKSPGQRLDDDDYPTLREITRIDERPVYSKPGQFGWQKVDQGSAFLSEQLDAICPPSQASQRSLLDLGCGYGYLTLMAARYGFVKLVATDNNAAALLACQHNVTHWGLQAEVIADDCASQIERRFDVILCNPPFHRGFDSDRDITRHFLTQIGAHLQPAGAALVVVNRFIQIESLAQTLFGECERVADHPQFKLCRLAKPIQASLRRRN